MLGVVRSVEVICVVARSDQTSELPRRGPASQSMIREGSMSFWIPQSKGVVVANWVIPRVRVEIHPTREPDRILRQEKPDNLGVIPLATGKSRH